MKAPIESSPKHVRRIGTIAVKWAMLDTVLARLMGEALDNDRMGDAIYYSTSAQSLRFDQLRAIIDVHIWSDGVGPRLLKLIDDLDVLWKARNEFMHNHAAAVYRSDRSGPVLETQINRPTRKTKKSSKPLTVKVLDEHIAAVERIGGELWDFVHREHLRLLQEMRKETPKGRRTPMKHGPFP